MLREKCAATTSSQAIRHGGIQDSPLSHIFLSSMITVDFNLVSVISLSLATQIVGGGYNGHTKQRRHSPSLSQPKHRKEVNHAIGDAFNGSIAPLFATVTCTSSLRSSTTRGRFYTVQCSNRRERGWSER
jgi:hypothetical protein